jgi:hypothetical protein
MMGESSNNKSENKNFAYKVDQLQKVPKEEYDTTIDLVNIQKIKSPLVNERKIQMENLKEENEERFVVQNNDDDDQILELSKEDSGSFPTDELLNSPSTENDELKEGRRIHKIIKVLPDDDLMIIKT